MPKTPPKDPFVAEVIAGRMLMRNLCIVMCLSTGAFWAFMFCRVMADSLNLEKALMGTGEDAHGGTEGKPTLLAESEFPKGQSTLLASLLFEGGEGEASSQGTPCWLPWPLPFDFIPLCITIGAFFASIDQFLQTQTSPAGRTGLRPALIAPSLLACLSLLAVVVMTALKLSEVMPFKLTWLIVFSPGLLVLLVSVYVLCFFLRGLYKAGMMLLWGVFAFGVLLMGAAAACTALKLDHKLPEFIKWWMLAAAVGVVYLLAVFSMMAARVSRRVKRNKEKRKGGGRRGEKGTSGGGDQGSTGSKWPSGWDWFLTFCDAASNLAAVASIQLLALRVDGVFVLSWWIIFGLFWGYEGAQLLINLSVNLFYPSYPSSPEGVRDVYTRHSGGGKKHLLSAGPDSPLATEGERERLLGVHKQPEVGGKGSSYGAGVGFG
uniref:Transmembrane protein n=1 Tax=Chromera velia CCMP2878 TaxID=1169474 RepID=A0A0G4GHL3_9ALVE|eukprot:Cvel_21919.t1-p1 / transcript=Cvel_21919.t1 / gene=Cvel_21919 / organism=Chromera_velia_CCMP2878 / gene_product=hypothetical protein / transcript_product=hypothetical protein / location=Cvel_scaffold2101:10098-14265(+) / protein_length=432 / sequence_SO=supercontig / SO=protein_coding / is_pseudo=false